MSKRFEKQTVHIMDLILLVVAVFLLAFVCVVLLIFYKVGSEPTTLIASVFAICGCEAGIMGWIKTNKDKQTTTETSTTTTTAAVEPLVDYEEPPDVGET